ncbi:hypothetical protein [Mucilaginibacter sp.]|uniref:PsbP-related protein n=1 Tax=Mucilaginibacter sp. TaxID=1882438 RepID=UPI00326520C3
MKYLYIFIILFLAVTVVITSSAFNNKKTGTVEEKIVTRYQNQPQHDASKIDSAILNWKTYNNEKLGISFQYPETWTINGEDVNAINLAGNIITTNIYFFDSKSNTSLSLEYHLPPGGFEFYNYAVSQYKSSQGWYTKDAKYIQVGGGQAIKAYAVITVDGKGNIIESPLRLILVDFLDRQKTGEIGLEFKTPLAIQDVEIAKFNLLLLSFRFTK